MTDPSSGGNNINDIITHSMMIDFLWQNIEKITTVQDMKVLVQPWGVLGLLGFWVEEVHLEVHGREMSFMDFWLFGFFGVLVVFGILGWWRSTEEMVLGFWIFGIFWGFGGFWFRVQED